jgi:uncharacterized protein (DUF1778 family)
MRYFSAPPYPRNYPSRRKKAGHKENKDNHKDIPLPSDSDSIHNSDFQPAMEIQTANNEDFVLEVVLPFAPSSIATAQQHTESRDEGDLTGAVLVTNEVTTNTGEDDIALEPPSRQVMEAVKILSIQEQVGIRLQGSQEDHLKRIAEMENRDRSEKEGWELNREIVGFQ